jgi:hypothetical protein
MSAIRGSHEATKEAISSVFFFFTAIGEGK